MLKWERITFDTFNSTLMPNLQWQLWTRDKDSPRDAKAALQGYTHVPCRVWQATLPIEKAHSVVNKKKMRIKNMYSGRGSIPSFNLPMLQQELTSPKYAVNATDTFQ